MTATKQRRAGRTDIKLSEVQLVVMRVLWDAGRATTSIVHGRVSTTRALAYTTVATLLSRLEKRGVVRSTKQGRERVFEPLVSEPEVTRHMVSDLIAKLFRGNPRALVSHLVNDDEIDARDLDAARRLLAPDTKPNGPRRPRNDD